MPGLGLASGCPDLRPTGTRTPASGTRPNRSITALVRGPVRSKLGEERKLCNTASHVMSRQLLCACRAWGRGSVETLAEGRRHIADT